MLDTLPTSAETWLDVTWTEVEPYYADLLQRPLDDNNVDRWLADWTRLHDILTEVMTRLQLATQRNTADKDAERRYHTQLEQLIPHTRAADQKLKEKLIASELEPANFDIPLRNMRAEASLFRPENLPLMTEEEKLGTEYFKITGRQTINWDGKETTVVGLAPVFQEADRERRERAWRMASERQLADREAINEVWTKLVKLRRQQAANAGLPNYRAYAWMHRLRFDYTPEDSLRFHDAIEAVAVPAAKQILEKRRQRLGVETLRPWDLNVDPLQRPPLRPFDNPTDFEGRAAAIFNQLDPTLGGYFQTMRDEELLDLFNRKDKRVGGFCTQLPVIGRPFIFMNAVGVQDNVRTLVHEAGHAFHAFEKFKLPYYQQRQVTAEFNEVASMAMELLTMPYWGAENIGYYNAADAARASIEQLEKIVLFWPYMAVVDAFQHWAHTHGDEAENPAACDAAWASLWRRFQQGVDYSGLEADVETGWQRKQHIHVYPFYYVEYGMAQLGALQVWANALQDPAGALTAYRRALALGGTVSLPALFEAAGASFTFDIPTLRKSVDLIMQTIERLEAQTA
jgi:oligoendopeptidase F